MVCVCVYVCGDKCIFIPLIKTRMKVDLSIQVVQWLKIAQKT